MPAATYFTVEAANALLPLLNPLMAELLERRARIITRQSEVADLVLDPRVDVGGPLASELTVEFEIIEQLVETIQSYGCEIKDVNAGLLDFLSERNGREVYLCWRFGEEQIDYFHELHTGYAGRQPL